MCESSKLTLEPLAEASIYALKGTISTITSGGSIKATELRGESIVKTSGGSIALHEIYGKLASTNN